MTATLSARADAFAQDFDRELTLAYMLFQVDPALPAPRADAESAGAPGRPLRSLAGDRAVSEPDPRPLRRDAGGDAPATLQRFNPATRARRAGRLAGAARGRFAAQLVETPRREDRRAERWSCGRSRPRSGRQVPAIVVPSAPTPLLFFNAPRCTRPPRLSPAASLSYIVLVLDRAVHRRRDAAGARGASLQCDRRRSAISSRWSTRPRPERGLSDRAPAFSPPPTAKADATRRAVPGAAAGIPAAGRRRAPLHRAGGTGAASRTHDRARRSRCRSSRTPRPAVPAG